MTVIIKMKNQAQRNKIDEIRILEISEMSFTFPVNNSLGEVFWTITMYDINKSPILVGKASEFSMIQISKAVYDNKNIRLVMDKEEIIYETRNEF